jgi:hypothetical protein
MIDKSPWGCRIYRDNNMGLRKPITIWRCNGSMVTKMISLIKNMRFIIVSTSISNMIIMRTSRGSRAMTTSVSLGGRWFRGVRRHGSGRWCDGNDDIERGW